MKIRRLAALLVATVLMVSVFTVSGCGSKVKLLPGQTAGYLHDWFTEDAGTFDFQEDTTLQVYSLARELFNTLVRYKGDTLELEPELLAEMPTVDESKTVYHFKLKPNVKFHDGTVLTSKDVKFTMERMLNPDGKGASAWLFEPIKGAKDIEDRKATELSGFKIISDTEFEITLEKPYAPFIQNLAVPSASILPEKACKAAGDKWAQQPIGTGPFKLAKYEPNNLIVLQKNPDYFEPGLPKLPGIDYVILPDSATGLMNFEKGSLDVAGVSGDDLKRIQSLKDSKGQPKFNILKSTPLNTYYLVFNMKEPAFKDVRIRKAIAMAIDKQKMVENVINGEGTVAKAFVTPGIPGAYAAGTGPAYDYNPEEAKRLLAEAGVKDLKITLWQRGGQQVSNGNIAIQGFLKEIGITADIQIIDRAVFSEARSKGTVPANYGNWWADIPDPDNYLYTYFYPKNSMSTNYNNPKVTALLDQGRVETDPAKRAAIYQEAERIIVQDDVAIVPLFHYDQYLAVQPTVKGVIMHPSGVNSYKTVEKAKGAK